MLCRVEMPSHEALFGRFYRYRLIHNGPAGGGAFSFWGLPLLTLVVGVLMLGTGLGPLVLVLLAALGGYMAYVLWAKPAALYRKKEGAALQTEVYVFTENGFTRSVRSEEGGLPENISAQYSVLVGAVETGKDFYLFTSRAQAYLVDKAYFTNGSADDLRAVLKAKLGDTFKTKQ